MKIGLYVLAVLAAIGFELSVISHVAALFESPGPLGKAASWLGFGIFVVMAPAILVTNWLRRDVLRKQRWDSLQREWPGWMKVLCYGLFVYALLNFVWYVTSPGEGSSEGVMAPRDVHGLSGHWMLFYFVAFVMLYSDIKILSSDRRCSNGHLVEEGAQVCGQCGVPVPARDLGPGR